MKIKIYKEKEEKEEILMLDLRKPCCDSDDSVDLVTVNESGNIDYYLLSITKDGKFVLVGNIPDELGLNTDEDGYLIPIKE